MLLSESGVHSLIGFEASSLSTEFICLELEQLIILYEPTSVELIVKANVTQCDETGLLIAGNAIL